MVETNARRAIVLGPGEGRVVPLGAGGDVLLKLVGPESDGKLAIYEFTIPPRTAGPPEHIHRSWDEVFLVLEGETTFLIDGQTHGAPAGALVFIPHGVAHTFWNDGDVPARQVTVFTPAGIEEYFAAVSDVLAAGGEHALEEAAALMERHDMIVPASARAAYGALDANQSDQ